jgi:signal transduction histidine kinase
LRRARCDDGHQLAIANVVVEGHGGALTVMSRKGIGSVFTVALPVDGASIEQRAPGSLAGS